MAVTRQCVVFHRRSTGPWGVRVSVPNDNSGIDHFQTDHREHDGDRRSDDPVRRTGTDHRAESDSREGPDQKSEQQRGIHVAEDQVTDARHRGQRYGMRDVGTDECARVQSERIKIEQHHRAQCTSTYGRECDEKTEDRAREDREYGLSALELDWSRAAHPYAEGMHTAPNHRANSCHYQCDTESPEQELVVALTGTGHREPDQRQQCGRQATAQQAPDDLLVYGPPPAV